MSIFAISFIILGHVPSVGIIAIVFLENNWKFRVQKFQYRPFSVQQREVSLQKKKGYGSEIVDFFFSENFICQ